ncbi:DUF4268 domain-containing protein [Alicyclobacillus dauci]|uniref:DUF4268 domain-containing protein n=1 Tax=Alicyclobacillus dauci TaxID=1475485 RepID=A0ABY6Z835_9BACL|nr:DUF4268 domain-containing protein [Alicyclobacillus dauci]WAH39034.1 DUF4268 domain-containing protein [Alicyclobacillus dauci]
MTLGRIEYIDDIRSIWTNEARDFTPWLANNIDALGEELGIEIELISTEQSVGPFSLDILAKDVGNGSLIAVENQLESTDHSHLGQLLTYASGLDAKIMIWIAEEIREEHRKAIDWLNEVTNDDVQFFAVEIQVITIGDSTPAPLFKVKASPNEWSKSRRVKTTGTPSTSARSGKQQYYHDFYTKLLERLHKESPSFTTARKVGYDSWYGFGVGRTGFALNLAFRSGNRFSCELYIDCGDKETNEGYFDAIERDKDTIESKLGALEWERLDGKRACRIVKYEKYGNDDAMVEWGIRTVMEFRDVFQPYVKKM